MYYLQRIRINDNPGTDPGGDKIKEIKRNVKKSVCHENSYIELIDYTFFYHFYF